MLLGLLVVYKFLIDFFGCPERRVPPATHREAFKRKQI